LIGTKHSHYGRKGVFIIQKEGSGMIDKKTAEVVTVIAITLLAIFIIVHSSQLEYNSKFGPGPGFLPLWTGILMLLCAVAISISIYKKYFKTNSGEDEKFFNGTMLPRVTLMAVLTIVFGLSFQIVGALPVIAIYMWIILQIVGKHKLSTSIFISIGFTIAIFFIFEKWVNVPLPAGLLSFLE
jgi:hypothetical protein